MKLILIRHGDPDFSKNSLTEKGWREAEYLSRRVRTWEITDFYSSSMGRALDTARVCVGKMGRTVTVLPWLHELESRILGENEQVQVPWDRLPSYLETHSELLNAGEWWKNDLVKSCGLKEEYRVLTEGLDELLASYGYHRKEMFYEAEAAAKREAAVVCFCHFGTAGGILAHLWNVSPYVIWQGMYLPTASVTVLGTEERQRGKACFRGQMLGDTSHLRKYGEQPSAEGYFTDTFCG